MAQYQYPRYRQVILGDRQYVELKLAAARARLSADMEAFCSQPTADLPTLSLASINKTMVDCSTIEIEALPAELWTQRDSTLACIHAYPSCSH